MMVLVPLIGIKALARGSSESDKSWEDAAQIAVSRANDTVRNVRSIWIENFEATVEKGKIKKYRINGKISFVLEG